MRALARDAAANGMSDALKGQMTVIASSTLQAEARLKALQVQAKTSQSSIAQLGAGIQSAFAVGGIAVAGAAAYESVRQIAEGIERVSEKAEQFGIEGAKFAAMLGISAEQASGLTAAIKGVGLGTDEYAAMVMRLEERLRTQESSLNAVGMKTRDANGQLLSGTALMSSAISTMEQYRAGTNQNEVALQLFGRRAADVYDIMRVTKAAQDQYASDMRQLGVNIGDTSGQAVEFEEQQARLRQRFDDVEVSLGQKVLPALLALDQSINSNAGFWEGLGRVIVTVAGVAVESTELMRDAFSASGAAVEVAQASWTFAAEMAHYSWKGNISAMEVETKAFGQAVASIASATANDFGKTHAEIAAMLASMDNIKMPDMPGAYPKGGTKTYTDPNAGAKLAREEEEQNVAAVRDAASEIIADDRMTADQRAAAVKGVWAQFVAGEKLTAQERIAINREEASELTAIDKGRLRDAQAIAVTQADIAKTSAQATIKASEASLNSDVAYMRITTGQKIEMLEALKVAALKADMAMLEMDQEGAAPDSKAWWDYEKKIEDIQGQIHEVVVSSNAEMSQQILQQWESITSPIADAFDSAWTSVLRKQESVKVAAEKMFADLVVEAVQAQVKIEAKWGATQLASSPGAQDMLGKSVLGSIFGSATQAATPAAGAGNVAGGAQQANGAVQQTAEIAQLTQLNVNLALLNTTLTGHGALVTVNSAATATDSAATTANVAATSANTSVQATGIVAWMENTVATIANTISEDWDAITNMIPSFDVGSPGLPHDMIAQVHKGEMIVPAADTPAVRAVIAARAGGSNMRASVAAMGGMRGLDGSMSGAFNMARMGDTNIGGDTYHEEHHYGDYAPTINSKDQSLHRTVEKTGADYVDAISRQYRAGRPMRPSSRTI
jgi:hypothetical protein